MTVTHLNRGLTLLSVRLREEDKLSVDGRLFSSRR